jgi:hypothetical protein
LILKKNRQKIIKKENQENVRENRGEKKERGRERRSLQDSSYLDKVEKGLKLGKCKKYRSRYIPG